MEEWLSAADPGRVHTEGRMARTALEDARSNVAAMFGTRPRQVIFTSGATESIDAATFGASTAAGPGGVAVVLADVEHSAVREASAMWAAEVVTVGVAGDGRIDVDEVAAALASRPDVRLVHCQLANHEVGTLQPVDQVAALCREAGVMLHVDAAGGAGCVPFAFDGSNVDLMSVSSHKVGGPAGVGALLVRRGLRIPPLIVGGSQERARRGGLENVAGAVGFGAVASLLDSPSGLEPEATVMEAEAARARDRIDRLSTSILAVPGVWRYGPERAEERIPHLLCVGVDGVEAEAVLIGLDRAGVAAHSGSACSSETLEPSPVLMAMGADGERSLRLSVGWSTTDAEIDLAAEAFPRVVAELRRLRA